MTALESIANVFNGKTPSKAEQRSEGHPVLKIKDVTDTGAFRGSFDNFVDLNLAQKHQARWLRRGDSLILNAAHNADYVASKLFLADESVEHALPTGEWLVVRPNETKAIPSYIHFWLRAPATRRAIKLLVKGIHLYPKDVSSLPISLPTFPKQRQIVDLLSSAEGVVRLRREADKKTAELIPALFLDMFGDPATNPKGWPVALLPDVLSRSFKNGLYLKKEKYSPDGSGTGVEMVHMSDAFYGEVKRGHLRRVLADQKQVMDYGLTSTDLLVARRSLNFDGAAKLCGVPQSDEPLLFESSFIRLTPKLDVVRTAYLLNYLNNESTRKTHVLCRITGITISGINQAAMNQIPVLLPPLEVQDNFACKAGDVQSIQAQQSVATAKAQAAFDALLAGSFATTKE
jgi:type I restriction enzyme S subunit